MTRIGIVEEVALGVNAIAKPRRPYKHLGRRVCNRWTGICGTITKAEPEGKRGYDITITWDDGHYGGGNGVQDISDKPHERCNHLLVADDYSPDYGPIPERIQALIDRIDTGQFPYRFQHSTEMKVGLDNISFWAPYGQWEASANLYGRQRRWEGKGATLEAAMSELRAKLVNALEVDLDSEEKEWEQP